MFYPPLTPEEVAAAFAGRFEAITIVYSGGQGSVFRATDPTTASDVALKIYYPDQLEERLHRETEALKRLNCPTLVRLHSHGKIPIRNETSVYVATSFVEGAPLSASISRGPLPLEVVERIGLDLACALDTLWNNETGERIVHRDIKPANIMLTAATSIAILIDLGVARHIDERDLTTFGKTWGTLGYMSPEQYRATRQLTCKSDVFALGIVLQECLLGAHPAGGRQVLIANGGPRTETLAPHAPAWLCAAINQMVDIAPVRRPLPRDVVTSFKAGMGYV